MKRDLTIIFLTVNKVPEQWRLYHRQKLLEAIKGYYLITVSAKPMPDMPGINLIQTEKICASNVYWQMLRAAKIAETPYIAIVEDDSLYPRCHFTDFRPRKDMFAYNMHRWSMYTNRFEAMYSWRDRISNLTLIAPKKLTIECLTNRFKMYPNGTEEWQTGEMGKNRIEAKLGLPLYQTVQWNSEYAVINMNHKYAMDDREVRGVKKPGPVRAYDIPFWGKAKDVMEHFK